MCFLPAHILLVPPLRSFFEYLQIRDYRIQVTGYRLQEQVIYTGTGAGGKWSHLQFAEYASLGACLSAWPCSVRYLWLSVCFLSAHNGDLSLSYATA